MLGYRHYADDVVTYFVQKIAANGMDIIRIFDALGDLRNLETAIAAAKREASLHVQVAIPYTTGAVFTTAYYVSAAKEAENAGADSICLKDMAGIGQKNWFVHSSRLFPFPFSCIRMLQQDWLLCAF